MIFSLINVDSIVFHVSERWRLGRPEETNYHALMYSLIARLVDRIPTIKDLVRRLKNDLAFRFDCGFTLSERVPSEATYSRFIRKFRGSNMLAPAY